MFVESVVAAINAVPNDADKNTILEIMSEPIKISCPTSIKIITEYSSDVEKIRAITIVSKHWCPRSIQISDFCAVLRQIDTPELKFVAFLTVYNYCEHITAKEVSQILQEISLLCQKFSCLEMLIKPIYLLDIVSAVNIMNNFSEESYGLVFDIILPKLIYPSDMASALLNFDSDNNKYKLFRLVLAGKKCDIQGCLVTIKQMSDDFWKIRCVDLIADEFFFFHELLIEVLTSIGKDDCTMCALEKLTNNQSNFSETEFFDICNCVKTFESKYYCIKFLSGKLSEIADKEIFRKKLADIIPDACYPAVIKLLGLDFFKH